MILSSEDKQFELTEEGKILWREDPTNPLPGIEVGVIQKGDSLLKPSVNTEDTSVQAKLNEWLHKSIEEALAPLVKLLEQDEMEEAAKEIASRLYESMGILPREEIQAHIKKLDEESRAPLRSKKIRMGPLLVYLPELNKPAAIKLRALLLTLWADKELPADVPADGIVSFSIDGKKVDTEYYRKIGYPIMGPRSIRVDMLDRVVCSVYDAAQDGKFQAQHQMAEWLGSNIHDLYAVLEAMGHKKTYDPMAEHIEKKLEDEKAEVTSEKSESNKPKLSGEKPVLATFELKKGSASSKAKFAGKSKQKARPKSFHKKKQKKSTPKERIYVAEAKQNPEDSPFAVLQQLQINKKD